MSNPSILGSVPRDWRVTTLGEICREGEGIIQTGPFGSQLHASDYVSDGVPSVMPQNLGDNRIIAEGIARISEADAERLSRHLVRTGDILFSRRGDVTRRAVVRESEQRWFCGTGCMIVRVGNGPVDPVFASYYFGHPAIKEWLVRHAVGATMPNLNTDILAAVPFILPPKAEQEKIAHVLTDFDDKIDLNRRMNATLEAMARALFQAWFVDFEPVRAKKQGWRSEKLGKVAAINARSIKGEYPHTTIQYIDISSVTQGRLEGTTRYDLDQAPSRAQRLVKHGDTIWSCVRPNRRSYLFIHEPAANLVVSTGFAVLSPEKVTPCYLHAWVTTDEFVDYLTNHADGSAYPAVRPPDFARAEILLPDPATLQHFEELVMPMRHLVARNERESRTLAAIRNTLLPKLMSGEVRVANAERIIGRSL